MGSETVWTCDICKKITDFNKLALRITVERLHTGGIRDNHTDRVTVCKNCSFDVLKAVKL